MPRWADLRCSLALIAERTGLLSPDDTELAWARTAAGDRWAFANAFLTPWAYQPDLPEILGERVSQAPEAAAALQTYLRRWRRLLAVLSENEADKLLRETLEDGPADRLFTFLLRVEATAVTLMQDTRTTGGGETGSDGSAGAARGVAMAPARASAMSPVRTTWRRSLKPCWAMMTVRLALSAHPCRRCLPAWQAGPSRRTQPSAPRVGMRVPP